jgi:PAS domain S-box-containing protein
VAADVLKAGLAAAAYFAAARIGYAFGISGGLVTLWPPSGLMLGLLLTSPRRAWPPLVAGGFAGSVASDLVSNYSVPLALFAALANLLETVVAALVINRVAPAPFTLNSTREVAALTLGGAVVANAATTLVGMQVLTQGFNMPAAYAWFVWWVGDGLGMLVVAPVVIAVAGYRRHALMIYGSALELAAVSAMFLAACVVGLSPLRVWGVEPGPYAALAILLWIAIRFGPLGAALATLLLAAIATWFAATGVGPFMIGGGNSAMVVALQVYTFIAAAAIAALFAAAAVSERQRAADALRASEARFREVVQDQTEFIVRWLPDGRRTFVNDAYARYFGKPAEQLIGTTFFNLIPGDGDRAALLARLAQLSPADPPMSNVHRATRGDGASRWQEWTDRGIFDAAGRLVELQSVGRDVHERVEAERALIDSEAELRQSMVELRALSTRLNEVREEERARVARDVHDHLGQALTVLKMDVAEVRRRARAGAIEPIEERLSEMAALIDSAVEDVRRVASELRPLLLDELTVIDAFKFYVDDIARRTGLHCELAAPVTVEIPHDRAGALFRILQEALTNVARHARASRVRVEVTLDRRVVRLVVRDDGCGLPPADQRRAGALGLVSMRDRARLYGGDVTVEGHPDRGTTVAAWIPLEDAP